MPDAEFIGKPSWVHKAGETLQWLVKFAEARQTVTYGELSKRVGSVNPRTVLPRILGVVGRSLENLSTKVPPIQLLVVNQRTRIPGRSGLLGFLVHDRELLERLSLEDKRYQWEVAREKVFDWDWQDTLRRFGLPPISSGSVQAHELEREIGALCPESGGEQEDHRRLKEYVAGHPQVIGLKCSETGLTEQVILSGDRLDVVFRLPKQWVAVEIKGKQSPEADVLRGIFQCVKYRAVLEAQRHYLKSSDSVPAVRVMLVLANALPHDFEWLQQILHLEVKANVTVPDDFSPSPR